MTDSSSTIRVTESLPFPAKRRQTVTWIIGNDADSRCLYRIFLETPKCAVYEFETFDERFSQADAADPDVILIDWTVDILTEAQTVREMRSIPRFDDTAIIVVSGFSQKHITKYAFGCGANEFLVKPIDFDMLESRLAAIVNKQRSKIWKEGLVV